MGIGLILVVPPALVEPVIEDLRTRQESPVVIGEITRGAGDVSY
jgi:phosphoribosylaminoimidazole (AIR) synthetase